MVQPRVFGVTCKRCLNTPIRKILFFNRIKINAFFVMAHQKVNIITFEHEIKFFFGGII
jgi:hypothetical protein